MAEDVGNHTLRLIQELRTEVREMKAELVRRMDGIDQSISSVSLRVDGNTTLLNLLAGLLHDHGQRISNLESKST